MRFVFFLLIFMLILSGLVVGVSVDDNIIEAFNSGEHDVEVIIEMVDIPFGFSNFGSNSVSILGNNVMDKKKIEYQFGKGVATRISEDDLEYLSKNVNVKSVIKMGKIHALLQDSVGIINATPSWALQSFGINLTGVGQSVCVIDSGVNYSHPDLSGNYLGGYDYVDNDSDPMDEFGHGTHVAGIIAANGGITGVAFNTGIIAIRVLDGSGSGSPADLASAIDWCVANASQYNISVISMSLGCNATFGGYDSYCDAVNDGCFNAAIAASINSAVANNISVLASTGNYGETDKISSPACIQNAIAVSSADKDDSVSSFSDRNSLVNLFAPGGLINSTRWNPIGDFVGCVETGNYMVCSGTSMATPMVAGAVALINQYLNLSAQSKTPSEIEDVLNDTGVVLDDSAESGYNFSRIDVYSALLSLDVDVPNVTLVSPVDNHINLSVNQTFVCNATDWQLANVTFKIWNSTGLYNTTTVNLTGDSNESSFDLIDMPENNYEWNCFVADVLGNSAFALANYSLTIGGIEIELDSPANGSYTNVNETNFTCNSSSDSNYELSNVTFYLWNSSGNLTYNLTSDVSGFSNSSIFNYTFIDEGNYSWSCLGVNNGSNESWGDNNFSVTYDVTTPNLTITSSPSSATSNSISRSFGFNVSDTNLANCSLIVGSVVSLTNSSINQSMAQTFTKTFTPGTYTWGINCSDFAGNVNSSSESSLVITTVAVVNNGGGSSGSTSSSSVATPVGPVVHDVSVSEVSGGYTKILKKDDKVNFSIFDFDGGRHLLTVEDVGVDYVNLTIESDPINFVLGVGQSVKLNLTSPNYYDLFIGLNNITDGSAELTIQLINEPIELVVVEEKIVEKDVLVVKDYIWVVLFLIVVLVLIVIVVIKANRKRLKGKKTKKKDNGKGKKTEA